MRITFFVHRYWPVVGGVEKYIEELGRALVRAGHEVTVVAGATKAGLVEHEVRDEIEIYRFPAHRSPLRCRAWLWRHRKLFTRAEVVSISNTHMLEYFCRMYGPMVSRDNVFLIRHGMSYRYPVPHEERQRARRSVGLVRGVVHDGEFIGKWLAIEPDLCPNQGLSPPASELPHVPEPAPNSAVYVGRVEPDSGIRIYLDAVRRLNDSGFKFHLDAYGDGTLLPELRAQVEREGLPVQFHGRMANAQERITDGCFAFIDGRLAIQEALARRRLVLAAYVDPLKRDYVGIEAFSPFIVPVGSGEELAARVRQFSADAAARHSLIERGFAHAQTLTWDATARAVLGLWRSKLGERSVRTGSITADLALSLRLIRESAVPTR